MNKKFLAEDYRPSRREFFKDIGRGLGIAFKATVAGKIVSNLACSGGGNDVEYVTLTRDGPVPFNPLPQKKWTVMIHLNADNNLDFFYDDFVIGQLKSIGSSQDINIVLLWDNTLNTHGYYYIEEQNIKYVYATGEVNMGNPQAAIDFIDFVTSHCSAEKYMWVYWGHGSGIDRSLSLQTSTIESNLVSTQTSVSKGISQDDTNGYDYLTDTEQKSIFEYFQSKLGRKVDIVGFDACLMATSEVLYNYKNYANYVVGSQQLEPGEGWDYGFLSDLRADSQMSAFNLAKKVVDYYAAAYNEVYGDYTLSAANLDELNNLTTAIDDFSIQAMNSGISGQVFKQLLNSGVYVFSSTACDLYGYMQNIVNSTLITSQAVKDAAQQIINIIKNSSFLYEKHGAWLDNQVAGISITPSSTTLYRSSDFCQNTNWDEFCIFAGF